MGELSKLPNIGKVVEEQLNQAGIYTEDELKTVGSKQAWLEIQKRDASAEKMLVIFIRKYSFDAV